MLLGLRPLLCWTISLDLSGGFLIRRVLGVALAQSMIAATALAILKSKIPLLRPLPCWTHSAELGGALMLLVSGLGFWHCSDLTLTWPLKLRNPKKTLRMLGSDGQARTDTPRHHLSRSLVESLTNRAEALSEQNSLYP